VADAWTVIGIGNPMRGDDGVGEVVARRVRGMPGVEHVIDDGDPFEVATLIQGPRHVLLVDATHGGALPASSPSGNPGPVVRLAPVSVLRHTARSRRRHRAAAALGALSDRVVVVGIEVSVLRAPALGGGGAVRTMLLLRWRW
jgi:hydrogenase maturation protease